jgi:uncharacterized Fe-S cluster-containing protein
MSQQTPYRLPNEISKLLQRCSFGCSARDNERCLTAPKALLHTPQSRLLADTNEHMQRFDAYLQRTQAAAVTSLSGAVTSETVHDCAYTPDDETA